MPTIQLQFRRGTVSEWSDFNPVLAEGEMAIETDTDLFKIGDGTTAWNSLSYGGLRGGTGPTGSTGPSGSTGPAGAASTVTGPTGPATDAISGITTVLGDAGVTWTARESNRNWQDVASSSDGTKLVAVVRGGQIYTSTDSGVNWTARLIDANRTWYGVASSSDGTKLVAVAYGGQIYTSTNSGVNWTARDSNRNWRGIASSADGTKLAATVNGGQIYTSTDSGVNWTARESNRVWQGVASSSDGTKLVATANGGQIYTSTDSGVNWTARESNRNWQGVASSSDGTKLVAVIANGQIYTSTNSGVNWTARDANRDWFDVASSADGTKLVATVNYGQIYTSTNSGVNWTARDSNRNWYAVASSSDGTKLVAVAYGGQIYTSVAGFNVGIDTPTPLATLDVNGQIVATGIRTSDGTTALPTYSFNGDSDTGMFRPAGDTIAFSTAGVERMRIGSTITIPTPLRARIVTGNITGTSFTVGFISGDGTYYYMTNTGFNSLTLGFPGSGVSPGAFNVFRNATATNMSVTLTYSGGGSGIASPLAINASNSATIVWTGATYVLF